MKNSSAALSIILLVVILGTAYLWTRGNPGPSGARSSSGRDAVLDRMGGSKSVAAPNSLAINNVKPSTTHLRASSSEQGRTDLDKAVRAFTLAKECRFARAAQNQLANMIDSCEAQRSNAAQPDFYASCHPRTEKLQMKMQEASSSLANCSPVPAMTAENYFSTVSRAAELGDPDAQLCYIQGEFGRQPTQQDIDEYRKNVAKYVIDGLHRGDWRVVYLMSLRSEEMSGQMINLPVGNPFDSYRFNRLLRLGATAQYAIEVDNRAERAQTQLSTDGAQQAQKWAQQEFGSYLSNSPPVETTPYSCENQFLTGY